MQLFKNLISCLRKDNKKEKPFSKIIFMEFKKSETEWDNYFFKPLISGIFKVKSTFNSGKEEFFTIIVKTNFILSLDVVVYDAQGNLLKNTHIMSEIKQLNLNEFYLFFTRIDSQDPQYLGYGFGRLMMEAMFYTLYEYAKENDLNFLYLQGSVGINAEDTPEKSIKLYSSFDKFKFGNYIIRVEKETLNISDKNIYYKMEKEAI